MSDDKEYEDLDSLTKTPGWLRFKNAQREHWETKFGEFVRAATNDSDDAVALQKLRQIVVARDAVLASLQYPEERLRQLTTAAAARTVDTYPPLSRRGTL